MIERLRFWISTWTVDLDQGVPYVGGDTPILGRIVDPALAAQAITSEIRRVDDVTEVLSPSFSHARETRRFRYAADVRTIYGDFTVDEEVDEPVPLARDTGPVGG